VPRWSSAGSREPGMSADDSSQNRGADAVAVAEPAGHTAKGGGDGI